VHGWHLLARKSRGKQPELEKHEPTYQDIEMPRNSPPD